MSSRPNPAPTLDLPSPHQDEDHRGPRVEQSNGFDVIDCVQCGFKHVVPLPSPAALETLYRDDYYQTAKPNYLAHAVEDLAWLRLTHLDRLRMIDAALALPRPEGGYRLLDIGSGPGFFLRHAIDRGFRASGIEPSAAAFAYSKAQGLDVAHATYEPGLAERLGRFDVITMTNMLEHVPNPIELVALAVAQLEPGGVLSVAVPNDFNPFQHAARNGLGLHPWWLAAPHHLNYFNFDSLARLLTRAGLDIVSRSTIFPMEMFLLIGEDYVREPQRGRVCHGRRKAFDLTLEEAGHGESRRRFYQAIADAGFGREAIICARKPLASS